MRDALAQAVKQRGVFAGDVFNVPDRLLTFADSDPSSRTRHHVRPVLVVQGDDRGRNAACDSVLVMPLSHNVQNQRPWEDVLNERETPLGSPSVVKVHLIQPIPRESLMNSVRLGQIDEDALARILAHLIMNLGLID